MGRTYLNNNSQQQAPPVPAILAVKRIRVSVSNNENARLLFRVLWALACTREELGAISMPMVTLSAISSHSLPLLETTVAAPQQQHNNNDTSVTMALFGQLDVSLSSSNNAASYQAEMQTRSYVYIIKN